MCGKIFRKDSILSLGSVAPLNTFTEKGILIEDHLWLGYARIESLETVWKGRLRFAILPDCEQFFERDTSGYTDNIGGEWFPMNPNDGLLFGIQTEDHAYQSAGTSRLITVPASKQISLIHDRSPFIVSSEYLENETTWKRFLLKLGV